MHHHKRWGRPQPSWQQAGWPMRCVHERGGGGPPGDDDDDDDDDGWGGGGDGGRGDDDALPIPDLPPLSADDPTASLPHSMAVPDAAWASLTSVDEAQGR